MVSAWSTGELAEVPPRVTAAHYVDVLERPLLPTTSQFTSEKPLIYVEDTPQEL